VDTQTRERLIRDHLDAIRKLQAAPSRADHANQWPPQGYYLLWHVVVGMMLGVVGASASLMANVIGASIFGKHPLQLIRVYLTFPMGAEALTESRGKVLTIGCLLYLVTGALYGVVFHLIMSTLFAADSLARRFVVATIIGLGLWIVNFYGVLSWLQPLLLGGDWIIREVPFWVAALTHLAFAWTMLLISGWGQFVPYRQLSTTQS